MDELKLNLTTKFMKGIITKLIAGLIRKQTGYEVDIQLNEVVIVNNDGKIHLHANVDAEVTNDEFVKMIKDLV